VHARTAIQKRKLNIFNQTKEEQMNKIFTIGIAAYTLFSLVFEAGAESAEPYQKIRLGASLDYTWIDMDEVNNELTKGGSVTSADNGLVAMLDLKIGISPFLMVGARTGYLYCQPASASYNYVLYNQKTTVNSSLIPVEGGLSANIQIPGSSISLSAGVYGGYGFAFSFYKKEIGALGQNANFTQPFTGGGFVGELITAVNFKLVPALSINVNSGYRLANISQMEQYEDVNYIGITGISIPVGKKGDILKNSDNKDLAFDFSGFSIGAGVNIDF
jgi:hypothetical protein